MKFLIRNKKGNTLAYTMMAMIVVFLMVSIVMSMTQSNLRQASAQEKGLQAYYVARSGAEAAFQTILGTEPSLLHNTANPGASFYGNDGMVLTENDIDFGEGTADVTAVKNMDDPANPKIVITSVGTLKNGGNSRTVTLEFYLEYEKNPEITWSD